MARRETTADYDLRERAFAGGDSGAQGIVPGKPEASELFVRVATTDKEARMPAEGEPLTAEEQRLLEHWIAAGAQWPEDLQSLPKSLLPAGDPPPLKGTNHLAFQPVVQPTVPNQSGGSYANPVDAFLAAALAEKRLEFSPEAEPRALIRRVSFDLVGLPPTPEEVAAFEAACRAAGGTDGPYAELVNRLLASPHHGERWARHWLDVVRFAESDGFEMNRARPYRDWVIAALNADMPFDRFIHEQIAGDTLGADGATGFLPRRVVSPASMNSRRSIRTASTSPATPGPPHRASAVAARTPAWRWRTSMTECMATGRRGFPTSRARDGCNWSSRSPCRSSGWRGAAIGAPSRSM